MKTLSVAVVSSLGTLGVLQVADLDVAYIPTPKTILRQMLLLARLRRGETLYDLGAGDGRVLIEATRSYGARAVGIEIDPERVARIKERLGSTGIQAEVIQRDFMETDLSNADVVTIYLSDRMNSKLAPKFRRELRGGARIVSLDYVLPGWAIEKELVVKSGGVDRKVYLYEVRKKP